MAQIIPEIQKTATLVQEISAASIEQNSGAAQIAKAVEQFSSVTQQNSAAAEEMSSTAEELASQAESLQETIGFFNIGKTVQANIRHGMNKPISPASGGKPIIAMKAKQKVESDLKDNEFNSF